MLIKQKLKISENLEVFLIRLAKASGSTVKEILKHGEIKMKPNGEITVRFSKDW